MLGSELGAGPLVVPVLANPGSALAWLEITHLVILNIAIGTVEGLLLAWYFKVRAARAVPVMIVANYFSAFAGAWLLPIIAFWVKSAWWPAPPLHYAIEAFAVLCLISFAMAVVLELPFVWVVWKGRPRLARAPEKSPATDERSIDASGGTATKRAMSIRRLLGACVGIHLVSYAGMGLLYAANSDLSLFSADRVRDVAPLAGGAEGWVYYARMSRGELRRVRLDATRDELVSRYEPEPFATHEQLRGELRADGQVILVRETFDGVLVFARLPRGVLPTRISNSGAEAAQDWLALDFRAESARPREVIRVWPGDVSVRLEHTYLDEPAREGELSIGWRTATFDWQVWAPTILPNGAGVFQLGPQVVLMDRSKRIGVLAIGTSPLVVLDAGTPAPTR